MDVLPLDVRQQALVDHALSHGAIRHQEVEASHVPSVARGGAGPLREIK